MTLNINATPGDAAAKRSPRRDAMAAAVLDELLSWNPREFIIAFRRWHQDAFSLIHLNVLTLLEQDESMSMSHLADALGVSVASMTGIADRMEKRGLVERHRDDADRRLVVVHATEVGRDVFRELDRRRREGLKKLLAQLDEEQLSGLLAGHRALREARARAFAAAGQPLPPRIHDPSTTGSETPPMTTSKEQPE